MGYVYFSMPKELVLKFKAKANIKNFIETGTYKGGTAFWAAENFENVITIEIDPEISKATASRSDCPKNIQFLVGNSKDVLPQAVKTLKGRSLFWLDGHWCNVSEFGKEDECPILDEIHAIAHLQDAIILIDDARAFQGPLPPPHNSELWPRVDEIIVLLKKLFPNHFCTISDDVIYCIPPDLRPVFDEDWIKNYYRRFASKKIGIPRFVKKLFNS